MNKYGMGIRGGVSLQFAFWDSSTGDYSRFNKTAESRRL